MMNQEQRVELAVVLAAGRGTRLYPFSRDIPKCLLPLNGGTILDYQLAALHDNGIHRVVIVTGYLADQLRTAAADRAGFVHNPEYATTNNLYSLWQARSIYKGQAFLCLHADLLFHPRILHRCLEQDGDVVLAVDQKLAEETMRVRYRGNGQVEIRKGIPSHLAFGTFLGMACFSSWASSRLVEAMDALLAGGQAHDAYFTLAIEKLSREGIEIQCSTTGGRPWIEIDVPHELEIARRAILPAIEENPCESL